jgi:RNA polymerase sigma-70 factor (ECF subfamily)
LRAHGIYDPGRSEPPLVMTLTAPIALPFPGIRVRRAGVVDRRWSVPAVPICHIGGRVDPDLTILIASVANGDQAAFASLYDALSPTIFGVVRRVLRDGSQAEEVTQEVFVEIWKQATRFDAARGSVRTWAVTIAHRRAVDRVRSAEASSRRDTAYEQRHLEVDHDQTAEAATANIEARRVRSALATLTEAQRGALELAYFGGYTHTEVAAMLDLPLGTAKTRIRDGLIRLRDTLGVEA